MIVRSFPWVHQSRYLVIQSYSYLALRISRYLVVQCPLCQTTHPLQASVAQPRNSSWCQKGKVIRKQAELGPTCKASSISILPMSNPLSLREYLLTPFDLSVIGEIKCPSNLHIHPLVRWIVAFPRRYEVAVESIIVRLFWRWSTPRLS